jgi:hypothetical protein
MHPQCPDAMPFASGLSLFWDDWRGAGDACPAFLSLLPQNQTPFAVETPAGIGIAVLQ